MGGWHSESLWGIRTGGDARSSLDVFQGRRARGLGDIGPAGAAAGPDGERVKRALLADQARLERQERSVVRQQERVLAARARLAEARATNLAIQAGRQQLFAARRRRVREARDAYLRRRRTGAAAAPDGGRLK